MSVLDQLTKRQASVYDFIRDKIVNRGYGPTVREIGERFDISSPNGVMCHLKALEKKGLIRRVPNKSRAIELTREAVREAELACRYEPNAWGVHDMHGNVAEWCSDRYLSELVGGVNPLVDEKNKQATGDGVIRGGAWCSTTEAMDQNVSSGRASRPGGWVSTSEQRACSAWRCTTEAMD